MYTSHYQTMRVSFEQICQGEAPWVALGNFMNDWYDYNKDRRSDLVGDPLPDTYPEEFHQWAAFCAASVEWFCTKYEVACPLWVYSPQYVLSRPWYTRGGEHTRQRLKEKTPEQFSRRNIFCGDRMFANKWEFAEEQARRRSAAI